MWIPVFCDRIFRLRPFLTTAHFNTNISCSPSQRKRLQGNTVMTFKHSGPLLSGVQLWALVCHYVHGRVQRVALTPQGLGDASLALFLCLSFSRPDLWRCWVLANRCRLNRVPEEQCYFLCSLQNGVYNRKSNSIQAHGDTLLPQHKWINKYIKNFKYKLFWHFLHF